VNSGDLSPQVIQRGDAYVIHNMDFDQYTPIQRIGLAVLVWDQVRVLMEANGQYLARDFTKNGMIGASGIGTTQDIDAAAARMVGVKPSSVSVVRPRLMKRPDVIEKMLSGEITGLHDVQRALGKRLRRRLDEGAESKAKLTSSFYGKGDKFDEALEPLLRYLVAHKKRGFKYSHVPPRAAQKRVAVLDEVMADLAKAREDLETRSHVATLRAPSEHPRRERS
jgi:hypothetical protein